MSSPTLPPDVSKIAGPLLILHLLQWGLFGVLSVQVYMYYLAFSKDPLTRKILVYAVYAAELTQTILFSQMAFKEFAAGFGNFEALTQVGNFWFSVPILSSAVAFTVQLFYAYRIKLLAKSNFIPIVVVLFALLELGGGIAEGVFAHHVALFSGRAVAGDTVVFKGIWNGSSAVCDIIIAIAMTYYLFRLETTWKSTHRRVQKLMLLTIGTGMLTAAVALIDLLLFLLLDHLSYYQTAGGIAGKMYSTTMMVVLNSRMDLHIADESVMLSGEHSSSPTSSVVHGGISVMRKPWAVPLSFKIHGKKANSAPEV